MEAILEFFSSVGQFFENILAFINTFFSGIGWLVSVLPEYYLNIQTLIGHCPPFIQVFLFTSWAVILLFAVFKLL